VQAPLHWTVAFVYCFSWDYQLCLSSPPPLLICYWCLFSFFSVLCDLGWHHSGCMACTEDLYLSYAPSSCLSSCWSPSQHNSNPSSLAILGSQHKGV
jgi:hypothetical protein